MCTELSTTFSAIQKKLVWVRYLLGTEPEGMILHNTYNIYSLILITLYYYNRPLLSLFFDELGQTGRQI